MTKKDPIKETIKDFIKEHGLNGIQIGSKFIDPDGNIHQRKKKKKNGNSKTKKSNRKNR